jgi:hypothetical protein
MIENLIPIAVVTAAGCETCAEKAVVRALARGSAARDIDRTLSVISVMHRRECFVRAVGPEVASRMERPLAAARRTLERGPADDPDL